MKQIKKYVLALLVVGGLISNTFAQTENQPIIVLHVPDTKPFKESDCSMVTKYFIMNTLQHKGPKASSITALFNPGSRNPSFVISDLDAKLHGTPSRRFIDWVSISYVDGNGVSKSFGTFSGVMQSTIPIEIKGEVQSITVTLQNKGRSNYEGTLSITNSPIRFCQIDASITNENE